MTAEKKIFSENIGSGIIVAFHIIGAIGILFKPEIFLQASFFNLILSAVMVFLFSELNTRSAFILITLAVIAFVIEVIGVYMKIPFGNYYYGNNLGPKMLEVPIIIGINWIMLLYCCNVIFFKRSLFAAALYSSTLMVLLDFIMEQNVEKLGFWFWKDSYIPFQNYASWFIISFIFSLILRKWAELKFNSTAVILYITQVLFFVYCYIFI